VLGNSLFVTNSYSGTVGEYDATTGDAINANFIMGLTEPVGIAVKSAPEIAQNNFPDHGFASFSEAVV